MKRNPDIATKHQKKSQAVQKAQSTPEKPAHQTSRKSDKNSSVKLIRSKAFDECDGGAIKPNTQETAEVGGFFFIIKGRNSATK